MTEISYLEFYKDAQIRPMLFEHFVMGFKDSKYSEPPNQSISKQLENMRWFELSNDIVSLGKFGYIFILKTELDEIKYEKIAILIKNKTIDEYTEEGDQIIKTLTEVSESRNSYKE